MVFNSVTGCRRDWRGGRKRRKEGRKQGKRQFSHGAL
jgi:hypothetical protein